MVKSAAVPHIAVTMSAYNLLSLNIPYPFIAEFQDMKYEIKNQAVSLTVDVFLMMFNTKFLPP